MSVSGSLDVSQESDVHEFIYLILSSSTSLGALELMIDPKLLIIMQFLAQTQNQALN